ncbi:MAG TPA: hypothetical protein PLT51_00895 [Candidatus Dojkabacteria bacterium]|nr:hypothetical protein [Candidatus Dojkabacteria bacterium]
MVLKFCDACDWAYQVWLTQRTLFNDNQNYEENIGKYPEFFQRLSIIA